VLSGAVSVPARAVTPGGFFIEKGGWLGKNKRGASGSHKLISSEAVSAWSARSVRYKTGCWMAVYKALKPAGGLSGVIRTPAVPRAAGRSEQLLVRVDDRLDKRLEIYLEIRRQFHCFLKLAGFFMPHH